MKPFSSKILKKAIAFSMVGLQVLYPMLAAADGFHYLAPMKELRVTGSPDSNQPSTGSGPGTPTLTIAPTGLSFGSVQVGQTSAQKSFVISNSSAVALTLGTASASAGYAVNSGCNGVTLPALGTCSVALTFSPSAISAAVPGTFAIPYSNGATVKQLTALLNATAVAPVTTVGPALSFLVPNQDFSGVPFGSQSTKFYTLNNFGNATAPLTFSAPPARVTRSDNCGGTLAAGAQCTVTLTYSPVNTDILLDSITVSSGESSATMGFTGTGVVNAIFSLSTNSLVFEPLSAGSGASRTVLVSNIGNVPLTAPTLTLSGAGYSMAHNCPETLAVSASCSYTVTFVPTASQDYPGTTAVGFSNATVQPGFLSGTGLQASLVVDTSSQDFGNVDIGQGASRSFAITNTGTFSTSLSYSVLPREVVKAGSCDFATVLAPGSSCTLAVAYRPVTASALNTVVTVSGGASTLALHLVGRGLAHPGVTLSSSLVSFGPNGLGTVTQQALTVTNTGNVALSAPAIQVSGAAFSSSHNCPDVLAVGGSCVVNVSFTPQAVQSYTGAVSVTYADAAVVATALTGEGRQVGLAVDTATQAFGDVSIGTTRTLTYTVTNLGLTSDPLSYSLLPSAVTRSGSCGEVLGAGQSCTVVLTFTPTDTSTVAGVQTLSVGAEALSLRFSGTGVAAPAFTLSSTALDFSNVVVGSSYTSLVTVRNTGNVALVTPTVGVTGAGFSTTNNCLDSLAVGATCSVFAQFAPTAAQPFSGVLSVGYSNTAAHTATLVGVGKQVVLSVDRASQVFGNVAIGSTRALTYTLSNTGNTSGPLSYSPLATAVTRSGTCSTAIAVGEVCTVVLTYAPIDTSTADFSLLVSSGAKSVVLSYFGTGVANPAFSLSTSALAFGTLGAGGSAQQSMTVTNTGNVPLVTPTIGTTGSAFSATSSCGSKLVVGDVCVVTMTFSPVGAQNYTGALSVAYSNSAPQQVAISGTGQQTVLAVDSDTKSFGAVAIGATSAVTYTVRNTGNIMGPMVYGALPSAVTRSGSCAASLAPSAGCTVVLTFAPTDTAPLLSSASVASGASVLALNFSGTGIANPSFLVSSASLAYGNKTSGAATQLSVSVNNTGNVPLVTPEVSITGAGFSASHNCAASLAVGGTCQVTVTFSPAASQAYSGSAAIAFANASAQSVALTGTGQQATLVVDAINQTFGNVDIKTTAARTYILTNDGNIAGSLAYGALATGVSRSGTCSTTLAVGASCTVILTFTPTDTSTVSSALSVTAGVNSVALGYSGTGVAKPSFTVSTATLGYGNVAAGTTVAAAVTLTNTGNVALPTSVIAITGAGYTSATTCSATLAYAATCTVTVTFAPTTAQSYPASLSVGYSNAAAQTVTLSGTGQQVVLAVANTSQSFGNVPSGSSKALTYAVTNNGNISGPMGYGALPAGVVRSGTCATPLASGASCTVILTYTPTTNAVVSGSMSVTSGTSSLALAFTGTGVTGPSTLVANDSNWDFGAVTVSSGSNKPITVKNTGTTAATGVYLNVAGSDLTLTNNTCGTSGAPISLAGGATCGAVVSYLPTAVGAMSSASVSLSGSFSNLPLSAALTGSGVSAVSDPYFSSVSLLLHMDSSTLPDAKGATTTYANNPYSTAISRFGGGSANFGAAGSGSALFAPIFAPTGDYTIEAWAYPTTFSSAGTLIDIGGISSNNWQPQAISMEATTGQLVWYGSSASNGTDLSSAVGCATPCSAYLKFGAVNLNAWNHFAVVRAGAQYFFYLNGTRTLVLDNAKAPYAATKQTVIGNYPDTTQTNVTAYNFKGAIDEVRLTKGVARYTGATYTVPTSAFPNN